MIVTEPDTKPFDFAEFSGGITDYYLGGPLNAARVMMNLELTDTRKPRTRAGIFWHWNEQIDTSADRVGLLMNHDEELLVLQGQRLWYLDTIPTEINGPNGPTDAAIPDGGVTDNSYFCSTFWRGHTLVTGNDQFSPQMFYKDASNNWQVRNLGLPEVGAVSGVSSSVGSTYSYIYAFCWKYSYTVGDQVFESRGPMTLLTQESNGTIGSATITLTLPGGLPTVENWDASSIILEIYRTINGGKNFYLVKTQGSSATSTTDTMTDATLQLQPAAYINGGTLDFDPPPKARFVHVMGDLAYYGYIEEGSYTYPYLLRQSTPGIVGAVPASFNLELSDTIKGIGNFNDKPVVFCSKQVFRIEGQFDRFGKGFMRQVEISPSAGCASHTSIVKTPYGIFWCGRDGVYMTNAYTVEKISDHLNATYKSLTANSSRQLNIQGTWNPDLEQVVWTACRESGSNTPDILFILDLRWGLRLKSETETPATFYMFEAPSFEPTAVMWFNQQLLFGTDWGYVMQLDDSKRSDLKFENSGEPDDFDRQAIIYELETVTTNFGSNFMRKWVPWVFVSCDNETNLSLQIVDITDKGFKEVDLKPIRFRGNITWGITDLFWGESGYQWLLQGIVEEKRRVAKGALRANHKALRLTNAKVVLWSTESGGGDLYVDADNATATLWGSQTFSSSFLDCWIAFSNDGYSREYLITQVSTNTVTFDDADFPAPLTGTYDFVVRGIPKDEILSLQGLQYWWKPVSQTQKSFTRASTGEPSS